MEMRTPLLIFLLTAQPLLAQFGVNSPFSVGLFKSSGSTFYPTNHQGYPAKTWHVAGDWTTNASAGTLTDRWTNAWHLTNYVTSSFPTRAVAGLNGLATLNFDGTSDYLTAANFTLTVPWEKYMVISFTNTAVASPIFFDNISGNRSAFYEAGDTMTSLLGNHGTYITNKFKIVLYAMTSGGCSIYTNNAAGTMILSGSVAGAGTAQGGLTFGTRFNLDLSRCANLSLAEMIVYNGGAVTHTNAAAMAEVANYLKSKYNLD